MRFGRVDVLANVAGIGSSPSLSDTTDDELERVLAVNLLGAARLIQAVLPIMKAQRSGAIVNVGSVAGEAGLMGIYSASKFGLRGLTDSVRREVRSDGIVVTLIEPGFVQTTMNGAMRNLPPPEIVADAIVAAIARPRRRHIVPASVSAAGVLDQRVSRPHRSGVRRRARAAAAQSRRARRARPTRVNGQNRGAVVVTGASSGIGQAAAELLAREGFVAFAGVRNEADAARVGALHPNVRAVRLDVTDRASIGAAAEVVAASALPLRGVVNNAGVAIAGPLEFLPVDQLRRQFEVNVFGALEVSQAFLPQLRVSRGRLIFVGSISGRLAIPFIAPYSASKFALRALTDALRVELGPAGIAVALLEPSSVKTPIWQKGRDSRSRAARAAAGQGDGILRAAGRGGLRDDATRGADRDSGRAGERGDLARAHRAQAAPPIPARPGRSRRQHRRVAAGCIARPRGARFDEAAVACTPPNRRGERRAGVRARAGSRACERAGHEAARLSCLLGVASDPRRAASRATGGSWPTRWFRPKPTAS